MYDTMRWWLDRRWTVSAGRGELVREGREFRSNPPSLRAVPDIFQRHVTTGTGRRPTGSAGICAT
jgi:hypothetical protein